MRWLIWGLVLRCLHSLAPPHPDNTEWESVHEYRRRLNITYSYEPKHLSDEMCKYLDEATCREEDEGIELAIQSRSLSSTKGKKKVLVVLCRFQDHEDRELPSREHFDKLFNGGDVNVNPVGSIREYYHFASMAQYNVEFDVQNWVTLPRTQAFYAEGKAGRLGAEKVQRILHPAMDALEEAGYDFSKLSIEENGALHHVMAIHSGYDAAFGNSNADSCNEPTFENRIWSQAVALTQNGWISSTGEYTVSTFGVAGAFDPPLCVGTPANMGVITHEFMQYVVLLRLNFSNDLYVSPLNKHSGFRLIDLYDADQDDERINIGGTGRFDIMSSLFGWNRDLAHPGSLSAYSRMLAEWLEPVELVQDGTYAVQAAEISSQIYKISKNFPDGEYLLIENRQPVKWDGDWPTGGIVIYHVDEKANKQRNRGYPGHRDWPAHHYRVAVVQADGMHGIELGISPGDSGDFFREGMTIGPNRDGQTFPNTDAYQGGDVKQTGIEITVTSKSQFIMQIEVSGLSGSNALPFDFPGDPSAVDTSIRADPITTGGVLGWILAVLDGLSHMLGSVGALFQP